MFKGLKPHPPEVARYNRDLIEKVESAEAQPTRRGYFVEIDEQDRIVAVDCPDGRLLGDFWLLCVRAAPEYAMAWLGEVQRLQTEAAAERRGAERAIAEMGVRDGRESA